MESGGKFWILHSRPFPNEFHGGGDRFHLILDGYMTFFLDSYHNFSCSKKFFSRNSLRATVKFSVGFTTLVE